MDDLTIMSSIVINAGAEAVWNTLINPEETKKYMFGCEALSGWKPGDSLLWQGRHEGKDMIFVKGNVVEYKPYEFLKYTVIDPFAAYPDVPENYLNVSYELTPADGGTKLTVIQDGFENAAEGEKRYKDAYNNGEGWNPILVQIKEIAEHSK